MILLFSSNLFAASNSALARDPTAFAFYVGRYTDNSLPEELLVNKPIDAEPSSIFAATYSKAWHQSDWFQSEWEVQAVKHAGEQSHWEFNLVSQQRWLNCFWDAYLDSSVALGTGISFATSVPVLEEFHHPDEGASQWLFYLSLEMAHSPRNMEDIELFTRIHHRSGILGVFNGIHGGSNIVAVGIRVMLDD